MLTTVAWTLADGTVAYALEGAIFSTGSAIQWLRDGLGVIGAAAEIGPLAASVDDNGGVYVVPAFTGLGSPWWDPYARGTIVGITRGTTRAHLARAVVEAMAFQTRDAVEAMVRASGRPLRELRVDGGASVMDDLLQFQADQLGVHGAATDRAGDHGDRRGVPGCAGRRRAPRPRSRRRHVAARRHVRPDAPTGRPPTARTPRGCEPSNGRGSWAVDEPSTLTDRRAQAAAAKAPSALGRPSRRGACWRTAASAAARPWPAG